MSLRRHTGGHSERRSGPDAMMEEYQALMSNRTWVLTTLPHNRKAIGSKWTFWSKENADGTVACYKARLVAKGYTQTKGVDFNETFAPVAKFTTVRTLIATAALHGREIIQADVSTAYLHADVETELYMQQPQGFEQQGPNNEQLVCHLKKSIYGLKQAGWNWNKLLDEWMICHNLSLEDLTLVYTHTRGLLRSNWWLSSM